MIVNFRTFIHYLIPDYKTRHNELKHIEITQTILSEQSCI